ncbi:MAG: TolC family protein [Candidatus Poribacteria bacterium]|nr:TolC family protein [Candidatus Poribacteria bacterium]MDE0506947.1 TolC family protein [Candidatus Poribacteria bacterium]
MKVPCNRIVITTGIFLLMTLQIPSAIPESETRITLESAVETALRENPMLDTIRKKIEVARVRLDGIALLGNPELETEFVGGTHSEQVFELSKSFQLGGQRGHRKRIAAIKLEMASVEFDESSRMLTEAVKLSFYDLVHVQEKLELAKEIIRHNQQMSNIAQARFEAGDISMTHVNLANVQLQAAMREASSLESTLQLTQLEINNLMGAALEAKPIAVYRASESTSLNHRLQITLGELTTHALAHRSDLKSLRLNARLIGGELRLAKAANIPDLSIGGMVERNPHEKAFGMKFSVPLPGFDRNRVAIDGARAEQQVNAVEIRNKERQIVREVMAALLSLTAAQKNLEFYETDLLKLLNENLTLMRTAYELGEAKLLEVVIMQNEYIKARFAYLDALTASRKAFANLDAAVGKSSGLLQ